MLRDLSAQSRRGFPLCPHKMIMKGEKTYDLFRKDTFNFAFVFSFVSQDSTSAIYKSNTVDYIRGQWDSEHPDMSDRRYSYTITCESPLPLRQPRDGEPSMSCILTETSASGKVRSSPPWQWTDGLSTLPQVVRKTLSSWGYKSISGSLVSNKNNCLPNTLG